MEDSLVKIAIRRILELVSRPGFGGRSCRWSEVVKPVLVTLAWVGLLLGHRAWAGDGDWATPQPTPEGHAEVIPSSEKPKPSPMPDSMPDPDPTLVGEHQTPIGGIFGDTPSGVCEWCGGGHCLPPTWSADTSVSVMAMTRPANQRLGTNSVGAGPLPAGSVVVTSSGVQTQVNYDQYLNDEIQTAALEVHTPTQTVSPAWGLTISRFLGRDGEERDHFLEFGFNGFENFSSSLTVNGSIIPFYDTTPYIQQILPLVPPTVLYYQGSLTSPFPIFLPLNGKQQELIAQSFSQRGLNYDQAFNRSDTMSSSYTSNFNEFELNYRFNGHNQPDQLVMNPNGHWYRECQHGYYYSYFFGMKGMVINEKFDYQSSGKEYAAATYTPTTPPAPEFTHAGDYSVATYNTLLGFQSGGKLEYRFCRWCVDTHGNAGMFINFAHQFSLIQTRFGFDGGGNVPDPALPYSQLTNSEPLGNRYDPSSACAGQYRFCRRVRRVGKLQVLAQPCRARILRHVVGGRHCPCSGADGVFLGSGEHRQSHQHQRLGILRRRELWNRVGLVAFSLRSSDHSITNFGPEANFLSSCPF